MPEPVRSSQRYLPGLDGLRALAVLAVVAYHVQFGWAGGGLLGVGVFFTLSGYLITDLLLGQWRAHGRLRLADFWLRRARRLLPALFVVLAVVTAWVTLVDRAQLASLRGAVGAAGGYVSNWYYIAHNSSYFARFAPPGPLDHLWSLAVEEQFYLAWPWLLWLGLLCLPRARGSAVRWLVVPTLVLVAASTAAMLLLYHPGYDPTRAYEGTDTRAAGLLVGAALAMIWPSRRAAGVTRPARALLDAAGIGGLAVIMLMVWRVGQYSPFGYRGGLGLLSVATAAVVAAVACPGSVLGTTLGWQPLRWLGVRSYGIYLWHYPVIVLTSPANGVEGLPRAGLQIGASIALAALSWRFVEEPVRQGALGRIWLRARRSPRRIWAAGLAGWTAMAVGCGVLAVACAGLSGAFPATGATTLAAAGARGTSPVAGGPAGAAGAAAGRSQVNASTQGSHPRLGEPGGLAATGDPRTSCRAVAHIGDSTSDGLISPDYLPDRAQRMAARYADVGATDSIFDISGARSVVETLPGQVNGYDAARALVRQGFRGCWVIALGTDDTADVAVGSAVGRMARIERMMSVAAGEPVMWVGVKTLLATGPYSEANMAVWNATLEQACARYPNMRIFDWGSVAKNRWFISDGTHYTSAGYAARARLIAGALAQAFPSNGQNPGCVVS
jgi:peptidoglycan/LPS O-acetylase OafA/YrhL